MTEQIAQVPLALTCQSQRVNEDLNGALISLLGMEVTGVPFILPPGAKLIEMITRSIACLAHQRTATMDGLMEWPEMEEPFLIMDHDTGYILWHAIVTQQQSINFIQQHTSGEMNGMGWELMSDVSFDDIKAGIERLRGRLNTYKLFLDEMGFAHKGH